MRGNLKICLRCLSHNSSFPRIEMMHKSIPSYNGAKKCHDAPKWITWGHPSFWNPVFILFGTHDYIYRSLMHILDSKGWHTNLSECGLWAGASVVSFETLNSCSFNTKWGNGFWIVWYVVISMNLMVMGPLLQSLCYAVDLLFQCSFIWNSVLKDQAFYKPSDNSTTDFYGQES